MPKEMSADYRGGWSDHGAVMLMTLDMVEIAAIKNGPLLLREAELFRAMREACKTAAPRYSR